MSEQDMLTRLRREIGPTLEPVTPLRRPMVRAIGPGLAFLASMGGVLVMLGPRDDVAPSNLWEYAGFSLLQAGVAFLLVGAALSMSIPARSTPPSTALIAAGVGLATHLAVAAAAAGLHVTAPAAMHAWQAGRACLGAVVLLAVVPVAWGVALLRRGLATRRRAALALIGLAGALGAEAAWRLHCEYSAWSHVLPYHTGTILLLTLAAASVASFVTDCAPE